MSFCSSTFLWFEVQIFGNIVHMCNRQKLYVAVSNDMPRPKVATCIRFMYESSSHGIGTLIFG